MEVAASFSDVDFAWEGDNLTVQSALSNDVGLVVATVNGTGVDLNLIADANGSTTVDVVVVDAYGLTVNTQFTVNVANTNDAPVANPPIANQTFNEDDGTITVVIPPGAFTDIDPLDTHSLTVIGFSNAVMLSAPTTDVGLSGSIDFTLAPDENGKPRDAGNAVRCLGYLGNNLGLWQKEKYDDGGVEFVIIGLEKPAQDKDEKTLDNVVKLPA